MDGLGALRGDLAPLTHENGEGRNGTGYAFRFKRSDLLTRRIADYLLFEAWHSPQLTFTFIVEPGGGALWLQVQGPAGEEAGIRSAYGSLHRTEITAADD